MVRMFLGANRKEFPVRLRDTSSSELFAEKFPSHSPAMEMCGDALPVMHFSFKGILFEIRKALCELCSRLQSVSLPWLLLKLLCRYIKQ